MAPPYNAKTPTLKLNVKTHKQEKPFRPILAKYSAPTFNLEKSLFNYFKPLSENSRNISSTQMLIEELENLKIKDFSDIRMFTIDVVNMYPSTNVPLAINLLLKKARETYQLTEKVLETLKRALELATNNTIFYFQGKTYHQKKGAPLGSPLSGLLAEIIMQFIEEKVFKTAKKNPNSILQVC